MQRQKKRQEDSSKRGNFYTTLPNKKDTYRYIPRCSQPLRLLIYPIANWTLELLFINMRAMVTNDHGLDE